MQSRPNNLEEEKEIDTEKSAIHHSLSKPSLSVKSVFMPSDVQDFIEGDMKISDYYYNIEDSDVPILFMDKKFPLKVMMKSRLERILQDKDSIMYECKRHVPRTQLFIDKEDVESQAYIKTTIFGLETVGDALIEIEELQNLLKDSRKLRLQRRRKETIRKIQKLKPLVRKTRNMHRNRIQEIKTMLEEVKIPPRIYKMVRPRPNRIVERVASKAVLDGGNVVGAKHCQSQYLMHVYTLREVYKKKGRKKKT